jgi:hypothetical protein
MRAASAVRVEHFVECLQSCVESCSRVWCSSTAVTVAGSPPSLVRTGVWFFPRHTLGSAICALLQWVVMMRATCLCALPMGICVACSCCCELCTCVFARMSVLHRIWPVTMGCCCCLWLLLWHSSQGVWPGFCISGPVQLPLVPSVCAHGGPHLWFSCNIATLSNGGCAVVYADAGTEGSSAVSEIEASQCTLDLNQIGTENQIVTETTIPTTFCACQLLLAAAAAACCCFSHSTTRRPSL